MSSAVNAFLSGVGSVTGDRFNARLEAFNKFQKELKIEDHLTDIINRQRKEESDIRNREAAMLGIKPAPSIASMYGMHYQVTKEMMDKLFDPSVMNQAAQDEVSMAKWAAALDQLNTTIGNYQQFYEMSFGDGSKADGFGGTYMDALKAKELGKEQFFLQHGYELEGDFFGDVERTLKGYENKHDDVKVNFDFESGQFTIGGAVDNNDELKKLYSAHPDVAVAIFSPSLTQAKFETPQEFALTPSNYNIYTSEPDAFKSHVESKSKNPEMMLYIADFARKKAGEDGSAKDYLKKLLDPNGDPEQSFETYRKQWVEAAVQAAESKYNEEKAAKQADKAAKARGGSSAKTYRDLPVAADGGMDFVGENIKIGKAPLKSVKLKDGNLLFTINVEDDKKEVGISDTDYGGGLIHALTKKYGPDAITKIRQALSSRPPGTGRGNQE